MRAIKIDPEKCSLKVIDIDPIEVTNTLGTELIDTIDFEKDHCLVIDDGGRAYVHSTCFRFAKDSRPFFGPVLILGLENGNWVSATLKIAELKSNIIWEEWDACTEQYAEVLTATN
ncbi:MAG: hypothetical protein KA230_10110 [Flavobacteriales bacterium]|nr:hypothetical protein [Flavobacteriales bacterium]